LFVRPMFWPTRQNVQYRLYICIDASTKVRTRMITNTIVRSSACHMHTHKHMYGLYGCTRIHICMRGTHTCMHMHTYIHYTHMYAHAHIHALHAHVYAYTYMHAHAHIHTLDTHTHTHIYLSIYLYMYVCLWGEHVHACMHA
jgi:hypothetical protein